MKFGTVSASDAEMICSSQSSLNGTVRTLECEEGLLFYICTMLLVISFTHKHENGSSKQEVTAALLHEPMQFCEVTKENVFLSFEKFKVSTFFSFDRSSF